MCIACVACKPRANSTQEPESAKEILEKVHSVLAIGKVVPAEGYAVLSSPGAGLVKEIRLKEGDRVQSGDVIMTLDEHQAPLDVALADSQLDYLLQQRKSRTSTIHKEEIKLNELQQRYQTSSELYAKNAETKEKMQEDWTLWKQQEQLVFGLRQELKAALVQEQEQQINIQKAKQDYQDLTIRAAGKGTIVELLADVGQSVSATAELGRIANTDSLLVEAEVDELFVDKVAVGQRVSFYAVGNKNLLGKGQIIYVSPTLMNKSILYERANEGDDRRVRRLKIKPDQTQGLLINAKVDCQIELH